MNDQDPPVEVPDDRGFRWYLGISLLMFPLSLLVFFRMTGPFGQGDIIAHAQLAVEMADRGVWFSYSAWYPIILVATGASSDPMLQRYASVLILSVLVCAKANVVLYYARKYAKSAIFAFAGTLIVALAMPLIDPRHPTDIYLGQITANAWHNSTTILASVFVVPTFVWAVRLLEAPTVRRALWFSLFISITTLAKPNYTLALLPALGVWLIVVVIRKRIGIVGGAQVLIAAFLPVMVILAYVAYATYGSNATFADGMETIYQPWVVWESFSANIALSILLSLCGPVLALVALPPGLRRSSPVLLSWLTLGVAVAYFALLAERKMNGDLFLAGNWSWALIPSCSIVFFVSVIQLARASKIRHLAIESYALMGLAALVFVLHTASGLYYMLNVGAPDFPAI